MEWKNININQNLIVAETGKATLINFPHKSDFDGFCFWHPTKLIRKGRHSASVSIGYTDDWKFVVKKYGKGKYNRNEVIEEFTISVEDFEQAFGAVDENIKAPK